MIYSNFHIVSEVPAKYIVLKVHVLFHVLYSSHWGFDSAYAVLVLNSLLSGLGLLMVCLFLFSDLSCSSIFPLYRGTLGVPPLVPLPMYITRVDWSRVLVVGYHILELLKERERRVLRVSPSLYSNMYPRVLTQSSDL